MSSQTAGRDPSRELRHPLRGDSRLSRLFLIGIMGVGFQLGPLGTAATNRPIVPVPGDYDDGEIGGMIGKGN
jgi:hypothetical protein